MVMAARSCDATRPADSGAAFIQRAPRSHRSCSWTARRSARGNLNEPFGNSDLQFSRIDGVCNRGNRKVAKLNVNGKSLTLTVDGDTPLLWALREQAGLTGTKYGCGIGLCGACSVHINGDVERSCSILVKDVKPADKIVTIEGLSPRGDHPVQKAWLALDVPQCGYC